MRAEDKIKQANERVLQADRKIILASSIRKSFSHINSALGNIDKYDLVTHELETAVQQLQFAIDKAKQFHEHNRSDQHND